MRRNDTQETGRSMSSRCTRRVECGEERTSHAENGPAAFQRMGARDSPIKPDECIGSIPSSCSIHDQNPHLQTPMQCRCGWSQLSSPTTPFFYTTRKTAVDELATGQSTLLAASTAAGEDVSRNFCSVHPDGHQPEAVTRQPTAEGEAAITPSAPVQLQAQYRCVRILQYREPFSGAGKAKHDPRTCRECSIFDAYLKSA